jgi:hypothetical protein
MITANWTQAREPTSLTGKGGATAPMMPSESKAWPGKLWHQGIEPLAKSRLIAALKALLYPKSSSFLSANRACDGEMGEGEDL